MEKLEELPKITKDSTDEEVFDWMDTAIRNQRIMMRERTKNT